ncbi:hypothetical protein ACSQ67_020473 [Phaseolus vulgaris]
MFRGSWFKKTIDTSQLDRFYLMLGILNAALFLVCGYYSFKYTYKEISPEDAAQPDLQDEENLEGHLDEEENRVEANVEEQEDHPGLFEDHLGLFEEEDDQVEVNDEE